LTKSTKKKFRKQKISEHLTFFLYSYSKKTPEHNWLENTIIQTAN